MGPYFIFRNENYDAIIKKFPEATGRQRAGHFSDD